MLKQQQQGKSERLGQRLMRMHGRINSVHERMINNQATRDLTLWQSVINDFINRGLII